MSDSPALPTSDQVLEALTSSGFILEQRVALALERQGYETKVAAAYMDPDENKQREIDVIGSRFLQDSPDHYALAELIVIECKSSPMPQVAFTRPWSVEERQAVPVEFVAPANHSKFPSSSESYWNQRQLGSMWEQYRINNVQRGVQVVRIERDNKNFRARNVLPEIGMPPIKAAAAMRRQHGTRGLITYAACVTAGELYIVEQDGIDSMELKSAKYVTMAYENMAKWAGPDQTVNYFDIVPYTHLDEWVNKMSQVTGRLMERTR
jgi:hypothetical protein